MTTRGPNQRKKLSKISIFFWSVGIIFMVLYVSLVMYLFASQRSALSHESDLYSGSNSWFIFTLLGFITLIIVGWYAGIDRNKRFARVLLILCLILLPLAVDSYTRIGYTYIYHSDPLTFGEREYSWHDIEKIEIGLNTKNNTLRYDIHLKDGKTIPLESPGGPRYTSYNEDPFLFSSDISLHVLQELDKIAQSNHIPFEIHSEDLSQFELDQMRDPKTKAFIIELFSR